MLKNSLLFFLIILILHFMIKNELFDGIESMKRKLVHKKIMEENEVINTIKSHHGHMHEITTPVVTTLDVTTPDKKQDNNLEVEKNC